MLPADLRFDPRIALLFVFLLSLEVCIALFVHDTLIRPLVGDLLVVILIYTLFRSFLPGPSPKLAMGILLFAILIEIGQYFGLVTLLGLQDNLFARIVIGSTFDWHDMLAYALGTALVIRCDKVDPSGPTRAESESARAD